MQSLVIQAVYENGVRRPDGPLPMSERQPVRVSMDIPEPERTTAEAALDRVRASAGMFGLDGRCGDRR
jgi:predicted DNA-binding antitoxin AbrB/MazE fold protein